MVSVTAAPSSLPLWWSLEQFSGILGEPVLFPGRGGSLWTPYHPEKDLLFILSIPLLSAGCFLEMPFEAPEAGLSERPGRSKARRLQHTPITPTWNAECVAVL